MRAMVVCPTCEGDPVASDGSICTTCDGACTLIIPEVEITETDTVLSKGLPDVCCEITK